MSHVTRTAIGLATVAPIALVSMTLAQVGPAEEAPELVGPVDWRDVADRAPGLHEPRLGRTRVPDAFIEPCNMLAPSPDANETGGVGVRGAHNQWTWPNGVIPYAFDVNVPIQRYQDAIDAMLDIESTCNVQFIPRTTEAAYINFKNSSGNSSAVGRTGSKQNINIFNWGTHGVIMHEIMHAMGIWHEQSRSDRDSYINVRYDRIIDDKEHNYDIHPNATIVGPYDFESIMHYGPCGFNEPWCDCPDNCRTIEMQPGFEQFADTIGSITSLSDGDVATLASMYGSPAPLHNDLCGNAAPIQGDGSFFFTVRGATTDGTSNSLCSNNGSSQIFRDVWFDWTSNFNGSVTVMTCGQMLVLTDTRLAVYDGTSCVGPILACNDNACGGERSRLTFDALAGTTYKIRVGLSFGADQESGWIRIDTDQSTTSDSCEGAISIVGEGNWTFDNSTATLDGPAHLSCNFSNLLGDDNLYRDVWFRWRATVSGTATFSLCSGTNFDSKMALYEENGTTCHGLLLECNDDFCGVQSRVSTTVQAGAYYKVRIGTPVATPGGPGTMTVTTTPFADNDDCANATPIFGDGGYAYNTLNATRDGPIVGHCDTVGQLSQIDRDLWYRWTPEATGPVLLSTCLAGMTDTKIAVYDGSCSGLQIACNDDSCGNKSEINLSVSHEQEYLIRVGVADGANGGGGLLLILQDNPDNDACYQATDLLPGTVATVSLIGATADGTANCDPQSIPDVWYRITAPEEGFLTVTTCGTHDFPAVDAGDDVSLSLHTGCPGNESNLIVCSRNETGGGGCLESGTSGDPWVQTYVSAGDVVYVRVAGETLDDGFFFLGSYIAPPRDACEFAQFVSGDEAINDNLLAATPSFVTVSCDTGTDDVDLWYAYTAPGDGQLFLDTCGTHDLPGVDQGVVSLLTIFDGSCNGPQIRCVFGGGANNCTNDAGGSGDVSTFINMTDGQTVYIRMAPRSTTVGEFNLNFEFVHDNDTCDTPSVLSGFGTFGFSTLGAEWEPLNGISCDSVFTSIYNDIWFEWTSPTANDVTLSTCGLAEFDTMIAVYRDNGGSCPGQFIGCDNDECALGLSELTFTPVVGERYLFRVGSPNGQPSGEGSLRITEILVPPANDLCNNAIWVRDGDTIQGTFENATNSGTTASCAPSPFSRDDDVWYRITSSCNTTLTANTCGTHDAPTRDRGPDTLISFHTLCTANDIACNDTWSDSEVPCEDVGVHADAYTTRSVRSGETVYIRVAKLGGVGDDFTLNIDMPCAPACPCELDGVPGVNVFDLLAFLDPWFDFDPSADWNNDSVINVFDLLAYLTCYFPAVLGNCPT